MIRAQSKTALVTAIILTRDEELHIGRAIESLAGLDCIVFVVDSGSTDKTVEIARALGATVVTRKWVNYADQFSWAVDNLPTPTPWVMRLDADEVLEPELLREMRDKLPHLSANITGVYIRRKHIFMGRWVRYGGRFPVTLLRIWRNGTAQIEPRWMDEHMVLSHGGTTMFRHCLSDINLKDLTSFIDKHNAYADREALDIIFYKFYRSHSPPSDGPGPSGQPGMKRDLKENFYWALPPYVRPILYFLYRYFLRAGFLDGSTGLIYHFLQGFWYRLLVDIKLTKLLEGLRALPPHHSPIDWLTKETGLSISSVGPEYGVVRQEGGFNVPSTKGASES